MYWLKGCPRCHGDLHEVDDLEGPYVSCIQCGKILTAAQEKALPRSARQASGHLAKSRPGQVAA